jgi:palmitoyltransferase
VNYIYIIILIIIDKSFLKILIAFLFFSIVALLVQFIFLNSKLILNIIIPLISFISLSSSTLTFIINPGIIYSDKKNKEKVYCEECKFLYPKSNKKMEHCFNCNICVCKLDHHCDVIGKCVGKNNTILFIIFVLSSFGFILSLVILMTGLLKL